MRRRKQSRGERKRGGKRKRGGVSRVLGPEVVVFRAKSWLEIKLLINVIVSSPSHAGCWLLVKWTAADNPQLIHVVVCWCFDGHKPHIPSEKNRIVTAFRHFQHKYCLLMRVNKFGHRQKVFESGDDSILAYRRSGIPTNCLNRLESFTTSGTDTRWMVALVGGEWTVLVCRPI